MKAKKITVAVLKAVTTISIILIVLFAIAVAGVKLVGLQVYLIQSPSMEPTCPVGSIIWVQKVSDPSSLKVNDVVTFHLTERTTGTHRIIRIEESETDPSGYVFITKGDNNNDEDNVPLSPSDVIGKEIVTIPYLGYVANYIQTKPGVYVAIATCIAIIVLLFVIDILTDDDDEGKNKKKKKAKAALTDAAEPKTEAPAEGEVQSDQPSEIQNEPLAEEPSDAQDPKV